MSRWGNDWRNYKGPTKESSSWDTPSNSAPSDFYDFSKPWPPVKQSKYRNIKTVTSDGVHADSKREAARWEELLLLQQAGLIRDLLPHPSFPVYVNGQRVGRFTGDALYVEHGRLVVEDVKSSITADHTAYRSRVKVFSACYPHIQFREVIR